MFRFILDEALLERLSPASRREILDLVAEDIGAARQSYIDHEWNPDGDESYPLSVEEARVLVKGMPGHATAVIKTFVDNFDGERGTASMTELLDSTGHTKLENIGKAISWIQLRVSTVTGDPEAWLVNWRAEDWIWDEEENRYTDGFYFISATAALALREAIESN